MRSCTLYEVAKNGDPVIFQVTDKGTGCVFAPTFPSTAGSRECGIEVNPGPGQWKDKAGFVYVTQASKIFGITPDGVTVNLFAEISSSVAFEGTGIIFDRIGTFGYDMILSDMFGNVYRVTPEMKGSVLKPF